MYSYSSADILFIMIKILFVQKFEVFFGFVYLYHYENMPIQIYWEFYHQKMKIFRWKILIFFLFLLKKIDRGYSLEPSRWGGSNEYPQSKFLSRNMKNNVYPCKPQFYYIKVGFMGVKSILACFRDGVRVNT